MAIRTVKAIPVAIREPTERKLGYGKIKIRQNVICVIEDESGIKGVAETAPIPIRWGCEETQESVVSAISNYIAPLLLGQDPTRINWLLDRISRRVGDLPYARTAVGDALYDLSARLAGVRVVDLLGGAYVETLEASWSIAFKSPSEAAQEAKWVLEQGYRWVKVKIGSDDPDRDVDTMAAVRDIVGLKFPIHVDANASLAYEDALPLLRRIEPYQPQLIEQPVQGWNLAGMSKLRRKLNTPIMADESVRSYRDLQEVIRREAADAVLMKLAKHGGIRESQKIADLADSCGIALYPGTHLATSIAVATSAHFYASLPRVTPGDFHFGPVLLEHDLVRTPLLAIDGRLELPSGSGIGVEVDESLVTRAAQNAVAVSSFESSEERAN